MNVIGTEVFGEVDSADASGGVAFKFYFNGTTELVTASTGVVPTGKRLVITDIALSVTAEGTAGIFAITDAAGKRILKGEFADVGGVIQAFETHRSLPLSITPVLIADAACGQVNSVIHGYLLEA